MTVQPSLTEMMQLHLCYGCTKTLLSLDNSQLKQLPIEQGGCQECEATGLMFVFQTNNIISD